MTITYSEKRDRYGNLEMAESLSRVPSSCAYVLVPGGSPDQYRTAVEAVEGFRSNVVFCLSANCTSEGFQHGSYPTGPTVHLRPGSGRAKVRISLIVRPQLMDLFRSTHTGPCQMCLPVGRSVQVDPGSDSRPGQVSLCPLSNQTEASGDGH